VSNIPNLRPQMFDSSSLAVSGAKWNFYETGTTTPKTIYTDRARTTAASNPVVADSRGEIARTFMTPGEAYTVTITDASDVTIYSEDDVYAVEASDSATATRIAQGFSSPLDFGAVGDGVADESTEVQAAITAATAVVDLLGKTFRCDSALTLKSGLTLRNGTLDFSNCTANEYLLAQGSAGGKKTLTGNAAAGSQILSLDSVSGIAADDALLTLSSAVWSGTDTIGEVHEVDSISSLDVTIVGSLESAHNTADTATASKLTTVDDVRLEDLTINCATSAGGNGDVFFAQFCRRLVVDNVNINAFKRTGIRLLGCMDVEINHCVMDEDGGSATGIYISESTRNARVDDCTVRRVATGISVGVNAAGGNDGVCRWVSLVDNKMHGVFTGIVVGAQSQYTNVVENQVYGGNGAAFLVGIQAHGNDILIDGNRVSGFVTAGVRCVPTSVNVASRLLRIVNNELNGNGDTAATDPSILFQPGNTSHETKSVAIEDNKITAGSGIGVDVAHVTAATVGDISVCGNKISVDDTADLGVRMLFEGGTVTHAVKCNGNTIRATGGGASKCIVIDEADSLEVGGNTCELTAGTGHCIDVSGVSDGISIHDNICEYDYVGAGTGIRVVETNASGISRVSVSNNTLIGPTSTGWALDFDGYINGLVIDGNQIQNGTTQAAVELRGDAAAAIVDVVIADNVIRGGDDCIAATNTSRMRISDTNQLAGWTNTSVNDAGSAVTLAAAATTFAVTSSLMVITGDGGANTVATITGGFRGMRLTLLFVDANVTITDTDAHTADTIDLAGTATNLTSADDTILDLIHDGTSWYEVSRSVN